MGTRPWGNPQEKSPPLSSKASQMANINAMIDEKLDRRDSLQADYADKAELAAFREAAQGSAGAGTTKGPADAIPLTAVQAESLQRSIRAGKAPQLFQDTAGNWSAKFQ